MSNTCGTCCCQQSPTLVAITTFLISTDSPLILAEVLIFPDMLVGENVTLPVATIPKLPPQFIEKLNEFPE